MRPGGEAEGCLTHDYIVLRVELCPMRAPCFEAREFERAAQEDRWFVVPDGYRRMSMGAMGRRLSPRVRNTKNAGAGFSRAGVLFAGTFRRLPTSKNVLSINGASNLKGTGGDAV